MLTFPLEILAWIMALAGEAESAAVRVYEVFDTVPTIEDRPGRAHPRRRPRRHPLRGRVVHLRGQRAHRPHRHRPRRVGRARSIAVVGATGSGKTTLVTLLTRLYDPTEGRITLDGHDLRDLTVTSLRRHVGFAFEEPSLFSASVRENLLMGKPDATEAEVLAALEVAQAGFALDLPWGLDTRIGEQGLSLSGGQRQRLALARAIIGRPADPRARRPAVGGRRPHRGGRPGRAAPDPRRAAPCSSSCTGPRRWRWRNRSILLDEGRLVAVGTHHDLLDTEPRYRAVLSEEAEEVGARMTTVEPDEVHDIDPDAALDLTGDELVDEWRGVNVEDVEEVTGGLAGLLRSRSRALLSDLIRPHHRPLVASSVLIAIAVAARLAMPWLVQRGIDEGIPPAARRAGAARIRPLVTVVVGACSPPPPISAVTFNAFLLLARAGGPGRGARRPRAPLPPLPAPQHLVPRALHVGPRHLPADLRRRGDRRPARPRPHQPHHLRRCSSAASASRCC